jgi:hypothetical protein
MSLSKSLISKGKPCFTTVVQGLAGQGWVGEKNHLAKRIGQIPQWRVTEGYREKLLRNATGDVADLSYQLLAKSKVARVTRFS